jgi:hypothetical protein
MTRTRFAVSRTNLRATGTCALVCAVSLPASAGALGEQNLTNEELSGNGTQPGNRKTGARIACSPINFNFTSVAGDDHISKSNFKTQCWQTQIDFIRHFDLERITTGTDDAFVKYLCHTKDVNHSGMWSISESRKGSCNPLSVISTRNPAFLQQ